MARHFFCQSEYYLVPVTWVVWFRCTINYAWYNTLLLFIGLVFFVYGEVVGRFWRWDHLLCGKLDRHFGSFLFVGPIWKISEWKWSVFRFLFCLGACLYCWDSTWEHERWPWISEPGSKVIVSECKLSSFYFIFNRGVGYYIWNLLFIIHLTFLDQLSVTIGILLAYLLGLFVNWRVLAILGKILTI